MGLSNQKTNIVTLKAGRTLETIQLRAVVPLPACDSAPDRPRVPSSNSDGELTFLSVNFHSEGLLRLNVALTDRLNPDFVARWIAVDNSSSENLSENLARFVLLRGTPDIPFEVSGDRGSLHHSEGLMIGKSIVTTRFLLVIDPDFYVLRSNWISDVLEHMKERKLSLFGSCWHPRWWYQYRGFPTVHFMMIDLDRLPLEHLDFTPGIRDDHFYRTVDQATWIPHNLRWPLLLGRFKDTGYRIREKVLRQGGHRFEILTPHFVPEYEDSRLGRLCYKYRHLIPDRLSRTPTRRNAFTEMTFLKELAPEGYALGWEEFFWQEKPFAVHLRNVGRGQPTSAEHPELRHLLGLDGSVEEFL